jgi:hypothetical protein
MGGNTNENINTINTELKKETAELKEEIIEDIDDTQQCAKKYDDLEHNNALYIELINKIISSLNTQIINLEKLYDAISNINIKLARTIKLRIKQLENDKTNFTNNLNILKTQTDIVIGGISSGTKILYFTAIYFWG